MKNDTPQGVKPLAALMAFRDQAGKLCSLAGEGGYRLEKGPVRDSWFLIEEVTGQLAVSERGTTAFSVDRAIAFLEALPANHRVERKAKCRQRHRP